MRFYIEIFYNRLSFIILWFTISATNHLMATKGGEMPYGKLRYMLGNCIHAWKKKRCDN
ncbi:hypothetical protein SAMN05216327_106399 [Dyadobacter sp. SG02]|nr:hypothetical protein SAMN05216327_106399 [Dyadobacter sp. SG02]